MDDLPFSYWDLMRGGAVPSPEDTLAINGHIQQREDELASVLADLAQLRGSPRKQHKKRARPAEKQAQLIKEKGQLQRLIRRLKSLFAPIRRLPSELLSKIFVHCLDHGDRTKSYLGSLSSFMHAPLLLLRVCVAWRDIALRSPRVWANLAFRGKIYPTLLGTWLLRSGSCLLDLEIEVDRKTSPFQLMASSDLVALCRRLHSLTIIERIEQYYPGRGRDDGEWGGSLVQAAPVFPVDPVDMPFLESLTVHLYDDDLSDMYKIIPLASAPLLRHCHIAHLCGLSSHTPLPWSQLTNLTLEDQPDWGMTTPPDIIDILRQCTNLVNLTLIDCSLYSSGRSTSSRPVLLPRLTLLDIQRISEASALTCLDLPSLQEFNVMASHYRDLSLLPQQCGQQIITFRFSYGGYGGSSCPLEEVKRCFARMPQIKELYIDQANILSILSESVAENEHCQLPKLQSIDIGLVHAHCRPDSSDRCHLANVVDFVKARWNPYDAHSESIREMYVRPALSEAPSVEQLCFLRRCLDEGLILRYVEFCEVSRCNNPIRLHDAGEWPVRKGDEERGMKEFGWTYPRESGMA